MRNIWEKLLLVVMLIWKKRPIKIQKLKMGDCSNSKRNILKLLKWKKFFLTISHFRLAGIYLQFLFFGKIVDNKNKGIYSWNNINGNEENFPRRTTTGLQILNVGKLCLQIYLKRWKLALIYLQIRQGQKILFLAKFQVLQIILMQISKLYSFQIKI